MLIIYYMQYLNVNLLATSVSKPTMIFIKTHAKIRHAVFSILRSQKS